MVTGGQVRIYCVITAIITAVIRKLLSISFIIALLASGWGSVLAATMCPHEGCMTAVAAKRHSASQAEGLSSQKGHCSGSTEQPKNQSHEEAAPASAELPTKKRFDAPHQPTSDCFHCMGAPALPVRSSDESVPSQTHHDAGVASPNVTRTPVVPRVASFPAITPTQGSPPTPAEPKYLLIQVFLI